jgi:hypothetical protein
VITRIRCWLFILLVVLGSLATLGILLHASGRKSGHLRVLDGMDCWAFSPHGGLTLLACAAGRHSAAWRISFVGASICVSFAVFVYIDGFFFHLDVQNGLLLLFIAIYPWAGIVVPGCVAGLVARFRKSR